MILKKEILILTKNLFIPMLINSTVDALKN